MIRRITISIILQKQTKRPNNDVIALLGEGSRLKGVSKKFKLCMTSFMDDPINENKTRFCCVDHLNDRFLCSISLLLLMSMLVKFWQLKFSSGLKSFSFGQRQIVFSSLQGPMLLPHTACFNPTTDRIWEFKRNSRVEAS